MHSPYDQKDDRISHSRKDKKSCKKPLWSSRVPTSCIQFYITRGKQCQSDWCRVIQNVLPNFSQTKHKPDSHEGPAASRPLTADVTRAELDCHQLNEYCILLKWVHIGDIYCMWQEAQNTNPPFPGVRKWFYYCSCENQFFIFFQ